MKKHWKKILALILVVSLIGYFSWPKEEVFAFWYGTSWRHRESITIDHTKVTANTIVETFAISGTWIAPIGVTSITVEAWGGGGAGGGKTTADGAAGGGHGGDYAKKVISVTPGTSYPIKVATTTATGTGNGANGTDTYFNNSPATFCAGGGAGGSGGAAGTAGGATGNQNCVTTGDVTHIGGNGGAGGASGTGGGGGGGGAGDANDGGIGGDGSAGPTGGTAGTGGVTGGGNGAVGSSNPAANATAGTAPGGGGGGATRSGTNRSGGAGAAGQLKISYIAAITNFPVLVSTTDTKLKSQVNGGFVGNGDGTDILFTSSDGATKLNHEIEKYASTTGQLIAWVNVPAVSSSVDTVIYMYFGNDGVTDQESVNATWDTNYKGVWHFNQAATASSTDSTSDGYNGTVTNVTASSAGQMGDALSFDGANSLVDITNHTNLDNLTEFTWSAWINPATTGEGGQGRIIEKENALGAEKAFHVTDAIGKNLNAYVEANTTIYQAETTINTITLNTMQYVVDVFSNTGDVLRIYKNGVELASTTAGAGGPVNDNAFDLSIGNSTAKDGTFSGVIDEARVSNTARTANWISTEYNNQSSPGTFETFGSMETVPPSDVHKVVINNAKVIINGGQVIIK